MFAASPMFPGSTSYQRDQSSLFLEYLIFLTRSVRSIAPGEPNMRSSTNSVNSVIPLTGSFVENILKFLLKVKELLLGSI